MERPGFHRDTTTSATKRTPHRTHPMHITVQPGTPIRLPLETAFTIDFAALLPEGAAMTGLALYPLFGNGNAFILLEKVSDTVYAYMPDHQDTGYTPDPTDPEAAVGRFVLYHNGGDAVQVDVFGSVSQLNGEPALKGTSGGDTLDHDAADPAGLAVALVDTSGGSDHATLRNGAGILLGRSGDDTLIGWNLDDALYGGGGLDALYGGSGNDRLRGMTGDDRLFGGLGRDLLSGGDGNDALTGGVGDDTLLAGTGNDTLRGEDGADVLRLTMRFGDVAARPLDTIVAFGGEGNDRFSNIAEGMDSPVGGDVGFVDLYGGVGDDSMYLFEVAGGSLYGGEGNDQVIAGLGSGRTGQVFLYGGAGNDYVYGGVDADAYGGVGDDYIRIIEGSKGSGGEGNDQLLVSGHPNADTMAGLGGELYGGTGNDTVGGLGNNDTLHGGDGQDNLVGNNGDDWMYGGTGNDSMAAGMGDDALWGGGGNDTLVGDDINFASEESTNDTLFGGGGDDSLSGLFGSDALFGGTGNDTMDGGNGDDVLNGGDGNNTSTGGQGADIFFFDSPTGRTHVADFVGTEDTIRINAVALGVLAPGGEITRITALLPGSTWESADAAVSLLDQLTVLDTNSLAAYLTAASGTEGNGDVQFFFANDGDDLAVYLHRADGVDGVLETDLTLLGTIENGASVSPGTFEFI
jgi:Ca2+-binding RTX toxin-like protein